MDMSDEEDEENENGMKEEDVDVRFKFDVDFDKKEFVMEFKNKVLFGFWLNDKNDIDLRLARFDYLMERRPELANSCAFASKPT